MDSLGDEVDNIGEQTGKLNNSAVVVEKGNYVATSQTTRDCGDDDLLDSKPSAARASSDSTSNLKSSRNDVTTSRMV